MLLVAVITFLSLGNVFARLRQRYSSDVLPSFRRLLKCRSKVVSTRLEIRFLRQCIDEGVAPRWLTGRVKRAKVKYSRKMETAFLKDELSYQKDHLQRLLAERAGHWNTVMKTVSEMDMIRLSAFMSRKDSRQHDALVSKHNDHLNRLKKERYGSLEGQFTNIFNLAGHHLSTVEKEVLSRGLDFGIPRKNVPREEVLAEFEDFHQQLRRLEPVSTEAAASCRHKLAGIAETFQDTKDNRAGFSLEKEHFKTIRELRNNPDLVITRPDKGKGVVILSRSDYNDKMLSILCDESKFKRLGPVSTDDKTSSVETSLQNFLWRLSKNGEIADDVYREIRPTGSTRPRIYGVPKVHKAGAPLRPILSMTGSPQHATAQWLANLLKPVSARFSKFVVKDSFDFSATMNKMNAPQSTHMCSFDIKSLFTNVLFEETLEICVNQLYHTDLDPPSLSESSFRKLMRKVTTGVQFSFNDIMYQQIDGVAMGSPLGPVLANIFVGYYEERLDIHSNKDLLSYYRYVDDTFSMCISRLASSSLLEQLNNLHPALQFTCEHEEDGALPFLDVLVTKHLTAGNLLAFSTGVYRKPTFTGQYTRWDSFCSRKQKINLIRCLTHRAQKICSPCNLNDELQFLRTLFQKNGYPLGIVDKTISQTLRPREVVEGPRRCPVYLTLPWKGDGVSETFEKRIRHLVSPVYRQCDVRHLFHKTT